MLLFAHNYLTLIFSISQTLTALGRHEEAMISYRIAAEMQPVDPRGFNGKGHALLKLGRYEEALEAFDKAIDKTSCMAEYFTGRARANVALGHKADALRDYDRSLSLRPRQADIRAERNAYADATATTADP